MRQPIFRFILLLLLSVVACEGNSSELPQPDGNSRPPLTREPRATEPARPTLPIAAPTQSGERLTPPGNLPTVHLTIPSFPTTNVTPIANYDAAQAITAFAKTILGKDVTVIRAGGASGNLALPPAIEAQVNSALKLAGAVYAGTLTSGGAEVALGSGSISGDMSVDIQSASLGAYGILSNEPAPTGAAAALALAKATYPGVAGFNYTQQSTQAGFMWYAVTTHPGVDAKTRLVITVAEAVLMGVTPSGARGALIWVVVGNGAFASTFKPQ